MTGSTSEELRSNAVPGPETSYIAMVWHEFQHKRLAYAGFWCVLLLIGIAVFAPLLASSQPLIWIERGRLTSPWLGSLFNRLLYENSVDILFNWFLVLSPIYLASGIWLRFRARRALRGTALWVALGLPVVLTLAMAPEELVGHTNPLHYEAAIPAFTATSRASEPGWGVFTPLRFGYRDTEPARSVEAPSSSHWLGTDAEGRDVFTRMLFGTRISLTIGVVAVSLYVSIGMALGAMAGYFGGKYDLVISRLIEVMICFPSFFLILTIAALIEHRSIFHVMVIIGLTSWTGVARLVRAEFLRQKNLEYVQAALALGASHLRIMWRHILPNAMAPVLVSATFGVASAILVESSLAFLGVGDVTVPSWGETLNAGRQQQKLWLVLAPGAAIFFVVSVFNLVGEGLRDALDPKLKS